MQGDQDEVDDFDSDEWHEDAAETVYDQVIAQERDAPTARYLMPRNARGMSTTMMSALKMTALRMALAGVARCITLSVFSTG